MSKISGLPIKVFLILTMLLSVLWAQEEKKPDVWEPFKFFIGQWEGTVKGKYGTANIEQEYQFALRGVFLQVKNRSVFEPQEKNPKGEVHEDLGLFSYDQGREKFVFRQFHVEGFVNQYVLDNLPEDGKTFIFTTESIENIPAGWRARLTYKILNDDEYDQIFELAPPEKDFEVCNQGHLKRKP